MVEDGHAGRCPYPSVLLRLGCGQRLVSTTAFERRLFSPGWVLTRLAPCLSLVVFGGSGREGGGDEEGEDDDGPEPQSVTYADTHILDMVGNTDAFSRVVACLFA